MNFYPFHIGDYAAHTRNLSLLEDLAYRRLLDAYYLAESPLNGSATDVAREIGMREHAADVEYVLGRFFVRDGDTWRQPRADIVIEHYQAKQEKASRAGKASAAKRASGSSTDVEKDGNGRSTNQKPITNNQSKDSPLPPKGEKAKKPAGFDPLSACPPNASPETWAAYCGLRKAKRAPLTENACALIAKKLKDHHDPDAVLNLSTQNGWTGVFPEQVTRYGTCQQSRGQGALSAVDAVKQAIAEREAAEAVAEASGRPVDQDDGALRPALDGEFRCVG